MSGFRHFNIGRTGTLVVIIKTYIADGDSIGLGQYQGGGVRWQVNAELLFIPDFPIFPLSKRRGKKEHLYIDICTKYFVS